MIELITDRTQADVDRVLELSKIPFSEMTDEEKEEWLTDSKGSYNASDLNRVNNAMDYVVGKLRDCGYIVHYNKELKTFTKSDFPTHEEFTRYIDNLLEIRSILETDQYIPNAMENLDYDGANCFEKLLVLVNDEIDRMMNSYVYCGQVNCGQIWTQFKGGV